MNFENPQDNVDKFSIAKSRALKYVEAGDLKTAIDSIVSDLSKTDMITEEQKTMTTMMGMALKDDPNISESSVRDFINGF